MLKKVTYLLIFYLVISIFPQCKSKGDDQWGKVDTSDLKTPVIEVSDQAMAEITENISSPVETAALIKSLGVPFSKDYLATTEFVDHYTTNFKQAYSLGVYGADLGYLNMYNKNTAVLEYIQAIRKLADDINVGQFFDFTTLKRLATNKQNLDSLMLISVRNFNDMDKHLKANNRRNLSTLMIAGAWVEGLYLSTQVARNTDHPDLAEKIGEQKITLDNLMLILQAFDEDPDFKKLISELNKIKALYKDITITIIPGEPEMIEQDGELIIIQHEKSMVSISEEQLQAIITTTEEVRDNLMNL